MLGFLFSSPDLNRGVKHRNLPRLPRSSYLGIGATHWIFTLEARATGWLTPELHLKFREILTHAAARFGCAFPVYCVMPDHVHMMSWNLQESTDGYLVVRFIRQHTAAALHPFRLQKQAYDHVLSETERQPDQFEIACHYILENPVRAELCERAGDYPYSGSIVAGYPDLRVHADDYWDLFWRLVCK